MKHGIPETAHRILSPLALSHRSLLPQGKMLPPRKRMAKISHSHLPVFCLPTKKGQDFRPDLRKAQ